MLSWADANVNSIIMVKRVHISDCWHRCSWTHSEPTNAVHLVDRLLRSGNAVPSYCDALHPFPLVERDSLCLFQRNRMQSYILSKQVHLFYHLKSLENNIHNYGVVKHHHTRWENGLSCVKYINEWYDTFLFSILQHILNPNMPETNETKLAITGHLCQI